MMTEKCNKNNNRGFTLVEVMIAMTVLLLGMLGVMGMQYYAINGNATSRDLRTATSFSSEIVEMVKSAPYEFLENSSDAPSTESAISGGVTYSRAWWVLPDCIAMTFDPDDNSCVGLVPICTADPDSSMAVPVSAIRVRTCWTDSDGIPRSVTVDSIRWDENELI